VSTQDAFAELQRPELYINRELAALEFNRRVLELASDPGVPRLARGCHRRDKRR